MPKESSCLDGRGESRNAEMKKGTPLPSFRKRAQRPLLECLSRSDRSSLRRSRNGKPRRYQWRYAETPQRGFHVVTLSFFFFAPGTVDIIFNQKSGGANINREDLSEASLTFPRK